MGVPLLVWRKAGNVSAQILAADCILFSLFMTADLQRDAALSKELQHVALPDH